MDFRRRDEKEKNLPKIIIVDEYEMRKNTLATFLPAQNIMLVNEAIVDREIRSGVQTEFVGAKSRISTYIHELFHWYDAEVYRRKYGGIDANFFEELNQKCKKKIEKLLKKGYNVKEVSKYARKKYDVGKYYEVYTEYRTLKVLGG